MKNLLLTLVILLSGITYAQECYPDCPDVPEPVVFDFSGCDEPITPETPPTPPTPTAENQKDRSDEINVLIPDSAGWSELYGSYVIIKNGKKFYSYDYGNASMKDMTMDQYASYYLAVWNYDNNPSDTSTLKESAFYNIDFENNNLGDSFVELATAFLNDTAANSDFPMEDHYSWSFNFYPFLNSDGSLNMSSAGSASPCEGSNIEVNINENTWDTYFKTYPSKFFLIYHELGHAVLNLGHDCRTNSTMHPGTQQGCGTHVSDDDWNGPTNNMTTFLNGKDQMFSDPYLNSQYNCDNSAGKSSKIIIIDKF